MSSPTSQSDDLDQIPGFRRTESPEEFVHPDSEWSLPPSEDLSTTLPPSSPRPDEAGSGKSGPTPSSLGSISEELTDGLGNFGEAIFEVGGTALNKYFNKRNHTNSTLWLVTDEEAEAFGNAAARIAARKVPEELQEGDPADAIIMASVLVRYGVRNITGLSREEMTGGPPPGPAGFNPQQAPPPPTAPPPRQPPAPAAAPTVHTGTTLDGIEPATPPPPDVISPDI